jgi:hypothetical protein
VLVADPCAAIGVGRSGSDRFWLMLEVLVGADGWTWSVCAMLVVGVMVGCVAVAVDVGCGNEVVVLIGAGLGAVDVVSILTVVVMSGRIKVLK